jgi:hypothetical protein
MGEREIVRGKKYSVSALYILLPFRSSEVQDETCHAWSL